MMARRDQPPSSGDIALARTSEPLAQRRRLIAAAALVPTSALALWLAPRGASAAVSALPAAISDLDAAAMLLFDAAEAGQWTHASAALTRARTAANSTGALEGAFTEAGGALHRFFQARNNLTGDLIEARTALSVKDRRWLVSVADRIVARAGELSQPFAERGGTTIQRIEVLLFLARRMRRALVWSDEPGYRSARDDFKQLWQSMAPEMASLAPEKRRALDDALLRLSLSRAAHDVKRFYDAVAALRTS